MRLKSAPKSNIIIYMRYGSLSAGALSGPHSIIVVIWGGRACMARKDKKKNVDYPKLEEEMRVTLDVETAEEHSGIKKILPLLSAVHKVYSSTSVEIYMPMYQGHNYPLPRGVEIPMFFSDARKMYAVQVEAVERITRGSLAFERLRLVSSIEPSQRRDCYRLKCSLPVEIERQTEIDQGIRQLHAGKTIDLSDGGMLFVTNADIKEGDKLIVRITLEKEPETIECIVLRTQPFAKGIYNRSAAVRMINLSPAQGQAIYKFIVEKQREENRWSNT